MFLHKTTVVFSLKMAVDSYTYTLGKNAVNILSYISLRGMTTDLSGESPTYTSHSITRITIKTRAVE